MAETQIFFSFCAEHLLSFITDSYVLLDRNQAVYPLVIAAHPQEANQFAVGLTDGSVKVIEPPESETKWGTSPPVVDNGMLNRTASTSATSNHGTDAVQR